MCVDVCIGVVMCFVCFCQAEDGIRYLVRSRGLGDVYKRQQLDIAGTTGDSKRVEWYLNPGDGSGEWTAYPVGTCLLYTSDAADERSSVDLGGRRIIKKKNRRQCDTRHTTSTTNHKPMREEKRQEATTRQKKN